MGDGDTRDDDPVRRGYRDNLADSTRLKARRLDEDPIHKHHRPEAAMPKAEHMNEPDPISNTQSQLSCLSGAVHT